jgi:hypothetical protein
VVFLFRDKSIINIFFLVILSIGVHFHFFMEAPLIVFNNNDGIFSIFLLRYISILPPSVLFMLYHAIILSQAIRFNMVLTQLKMFHNNAYTTAMAYVLLSGVLTQWCTISSALVANYLLIWLFIKLSRLYNHPSPKTLLFNTGLIVGISVICFHPTAILILLVLFALAVVRPFVLAEWVILLMGILLPFYFLVSWLFLNDEFSKFYSLLPRLQWNLPFAHWDAQLVIQFSVLIFTLLTGFYFWQITNKRMVIQIRKNWGVMIVMLFILIPIPFVFLHAGLESAFLSLVPLAAFASNTYSYPRKLLLPNLLFWFSLIVIMYNNWMLIKN